MRDDKVLFFVHVEMNQQYYYPSFHCLYKLEDKLAIGIQIKLLLSNLLASDENNYGIFT